MLSFSWLSSIFWGCVAFWAVVGDLGCFSSKTVGISRGCGFALQIKGMKDRLEFWCTDVRSMEMLVEHQAHDILT